MGGGGSPRHSDPRRRGPPETGQVTQPYIMEAGPPESEPRLRKQNTAGRKQQHLQRYHRQVRRKIRQLPDSLNRLVMAHEQERPKLESGASGGGHVVSFEETRSLHHRSKRSAESPSWPEPEKTGHTEPWPTPAKQTPVTG